MYMALSGGLFVAGVWAVDIPIMIVLGKRVWMLGKKYHYVTPADLLADRYYSQTVRLITAVYCVLFTIFHIAVQFTGSAYVMTTMTNGMIPHGWAAALVAFFMGLYIALGGMRAVAWTDAIQAVLLFVAMIVLVFVALWSAGGWRGFSNVAQSYTDLMRINMSPFYVASVGVAIGLSVLVWPQMWVRYYAGSK